MYAANSNRPELCKRNTYRAKELNCRICEPTVVLGDVNLFSMRDWQHREPEAVKTQCSSNAIHPRDS